MALIPAVVTDAARRYLPQFFGNFLGISAGATTAGHWNPLLKSFKIGRGGWIDKGVGPVPRDPDPLLTDLDVILDAARSAPTKRYTSLAGNILFVEKTLSSLDLSYDTVAPYSLNVRCQLQGNEFNDIQGVPSTPPGGATLPSSSTSPQLWEVGVFCDHPSGTGELMVLYGTFPVEVKLVGSLIENVLIYSF